MKLLNKFKKPLVSVDWLYDNMQASNLVILDATIPKVTESRIEFEGKFRIPKARFFDIKKKFSDASGEFPNTLPSAQQFQNEARQLGINTNSAIVVYDDLGIYSGARAWWLFKVFGHNNVAVLDGGLPEWKKQNKKVESLSNKPYEFGDFEVKSNLHLMTNFEGVNQYSENINTVILDARSQSRFNGLVPEPREGLRSGTIPNSKSLPFTNLLIDHKFKSGDALQSIFNELSDKNKTLVFSCGSGITACNLALGAMLSGYENLVVYDGSWTEYGSLTT